MHYLKNTKPEVNVQFALDQSISKVQLDYKTAASRLSYEVGVNGEKKSIEAGILLIKMDIAHFTLVNMEILTF